MHRCLQRPQGRRTRLDIDHSNCEQTLQTGKTPGRLPLIAQTRVFHEPSRPVELQLDKLMLLQVGWNQLSYLRLSNVSYSPCGKNWQHSGQS